MALMAAGSSLVNGNPGSRALHSPPPISTLGVRSLREEYSKPVHRNDIPRNLELIEERLEKDDQNDLVVASEERVEIPRFHHLFQGGEMFPPPVFVAALELGTAETLNGRQMLYDADVLTYRDNLVMLYKPLVAKIRQLHSKEIEELPHRAVINFTRAWTAFESAWLRSREAHAVEALQPLAKAILSLEPLLNSVEKERLLPWPRVQHQKVVTLKCLEGFIHALSDLAASVLPSLQRELDHDTKLLLLMDHVLSVHGDKSVKHCLEGVSSTPEVSFPDHQSQHAPHASGAASRDGAKGMTLDAYAFKLLGGSVARIDPKASQISLEATAGGRGGPVAANGFKENEFSRRAATHAAELLSTFEAVKDVLLALKSTLERIDPALDKDEVFVGYLQRFERAFRRAKRLFLEPDNLA